MTKPRKPRKPRKRRNGAGKAKPTEERLFRSLIDRSTDMIEVVDPDTGRILDVNERTCQILGYSRDELLTFHISDIDPTVDERSFKLAAAQLRSAGALAWEGLHRRKDGSTLPVEVNISLVRLETDYFVAIVRDVSSRALAEVERDRLIAAIEQAAETFVITDTRGHILYVNSAFERLTGYTRAEVTGQNPRILKSGTQDAEFYRAMWAALTSGKVWNTKFVNRRKDGTLYHQHTTISGIRDRSGQIGNFVGVGRDITHEVNLEARLEQSLQYTRMIVDASPVGIITYKASGEAVSANQAAATMVGATREQLEAQNFRTIPSWEASGLRQAALQALDTGTGTSLEVHLITTFGRDAWLSTRFVPFQFAGETQLLALFTDVTERKKIEAQFTQAQKMEAVGRLAGGVAHDFNNLLTVILGSGQFLQQSLAAEAPEREDVDEILKAGARATALTRQLLAFSRKQIMDPRVLDLNALVSGVDKLLRRLIGEDIEIVTALAQGLGAVRADPGQLEQVLVNLAVNARDAMPNGGKLIMETANVDLDESFTRTHVGAKPGKHVLFAVSDTGTGMTAETQAHAFEPFFTTKAAGKGTGLGLATVYGIVKQSGGYVAIYSELGLGTTFKIYLPRVDAELDATAGATGGDTTRLRGTETVLVAEDNESVVEVLKRALMPLGYRIVTARGGSEVLELADQHEGPIHLLVTDVVMPVMSGRATADRLREKRPEIRVLYMSGYTDEAIVHHGVLEPGIAFLQKPFTPDAFARKVREVLDAASRASS